MAQLPTPPEVRHQRLTTFREAARFAARESVAVRAAVDQRLVESRACLTATTSLLRQLSPPPAGQLAAWHVRPVSSPAPPRTTAGRAAAHRC